MAVQYSLFQNLPLELLEMIFQHLVRSPYSLHNLALTCRRIYDITITALYSSICLTDPVRCEQLASTMQQSAWLSSLVQEIQVHFHNARPDQIHEALLDAIFEMHNLKSLSVRSVPLKGILDSTSHRLLNMLAKNDNIETESRTQYTGQRLRSLYLGEAFRIHADEPSWLLGPSEIVFYMEELEKLHIQGARIRPLHRATFGPRFPTKKTALKDLALLNCDVSPDTFAEILAFPKGLTHLTMKGRWLRTNGPFECSLNTSDYIKEIQRSSSAGVVYLDLDIWNPDDPPS